MCNFEGLEEFLNLTCGSEEKCDRTGKPHLSWTPIVNARRSITDFPTEPEAEYPPDLCVAIANGCCRFLETETGKLRPARFDFTEVFSGPRAPLTRELAAKQILCASSANAQGQETLRACTGDMQGPESCKAVGSAPAVKVRLMSREDVEARGELTRTGRWSNRMVRVPGRREAGNQVS